MSNIHTDEDGFEYEGDLLELIDSGVLEGDVMDEEDNLVSVVFTMEELKELSTYLGVIANQVHPQVAASLPPVYQQLIDFGREATVGRE